MNIIKQEYKYLVFLDVDGVLNKLHVPEEDLLLDACTMIDISHPAHPNLNIHCMDYFRAVLDMFGSDVKIVLSSSWRLDLSLVAFLKTTTAQQFGCDIFEESLVGSTNNKVTGDRSSDITTWIIENVQNIDTVAWIALDDDARNLQLIDNAHKVVTYGSVGLTRSDVDQAISKLNIQVS